METKEYQPSEEITREPALLPHRRPVPPPKPNRTAPLLTGIAVAAVLIAIGVIPRMQKKSALAAEAHTAITDAPVVNVVHPLLAPASTSLTLPGSIQAFDTTTVNAQTTGYVRKYLVDIGYRVKKGQVLAIIESPEVDQQLLAARANSARSEATVGQTKADVEKMRAQVAQASAQRGASVAGVAQARADYLRFKAKAQQAKTAISTSKAKLSEANKALDARKADVVRVQSAVDIASRTLKRWKELGKVNAVALQEVDEKQADFDSASASLSAAQAAVEEASATVDASANDIESARQNSSAAAADVDAAHERISAAQATVVSNDAGVSAARANVSADEENVAAAESAVVSSQATSGQYAAMKNFQQVVAPFDGVITARNVDVGTLVGPGTGGGAGEADPTRTVTHGGLFGIARTDSLRIQAGVPQTFVPYLHVGQTAQVTVEQFPGRVFTGKIFTMSGAMDSGSRTMLVEVLLQNPTGALVPGMFTQLKLIGSRANPPMIVPANALVFNAQGERVAIVTSKNNVHFEPIEIARDLGSTAEVGSGLSTADSLIVDPSDDLIEGQSVQPNRAGSERSAK